MSTRKHTSHRPQKAQNSDSEKVAVIGSKSEEAIWRDLTFSNNPPKGAKHAAELAEIWGCSARTAYHRATTLAKLGKIEDCGLFSGRFVRRYFRLLNSESKSKKRR
jgi:hypothetical protein